MKNLFLGLRLAGALALLAGIYGCFAAVLHQPLSAVALVGILVGALAVEIAWLYLRWLSPLHSWFGDSDQELSLVRAVERELSRSLRHHAPLVVVAFRGKRGLRRAAVVKMLRFSDIVLVGSDRHIVILMTETTRENARAVVERMIEQLPVRGAVMADQTVITPATTLAGFQARHHIQEATTHSPTLALLQGLRLGLFRSETRARGGQPAVLYDLVDDDVIAANATTNQRSMDDLTRQVA